MNIMYDIVMAIYFACISSYYTHRSLSKDDLNAALPF